MSKMSTETTKTQLAGATMGTRWSVIIDGPDAPKTPALQAALQQAVQDVDTQMSTWTDTSDLMRLNAAPVGAWVTLPQHLIHVLKTGLALSETTQGAFEMNVGSAVRAWGFGAGQIDLTAIRAASNASRISATDALRLDEDNLRARKSAPLALDLSGIAKGYGVDRLAAIAGGFGIRHALCAIDGEVRAVGTQANGAPWAVAIETPDAPDRAPLSVTTVEDCAIATSGDYRHFVEVKGHRLSHTIDPRRGTPLVTAPASVTVIMQNCAQADAMATALMVMGQEAGLAFARANGISALFVMREGQGFQSSGSGVFAA